MKDPADALTAELPLLGVVALPDWLRSAVDLCPAEAAAFAVLLSELQQLPLGVHSDIFFAAYDRMLEARACLYDAWRSQDFDEDDDA